VSDIMFSYNSFLRGLVLVIFSNSYYSSKTVSYP